MRTFHRAQSFLSLLLWGLEESLSPLPPNCPVYPLTIPLLQLLIIPCVLMFNGQTVLLISQVIKCICYVSPVCPALSGHSERRMQTLPGFTLTLQLEKITKVFMI